MPKFRVTFEETTLYTATVEAATPEEAEAKVLKQRPENPYVVDITERIAGSEFGVDPEQVRG